MSNYCKECFKKQEEIEQLKADIKSRTMCITCERELQNCNLQAENERLKEEVETWNYQADKRAELSDIWFNTAETYKQALQEIKEIARNEVETRMLFSDEKSFCDFNDILTKINEVIGAE